jgi:DNA-binding GntR family transcriptional regulator/AraC-like DNA-binding protein
MVPGGQPLDAGRRRLARDLFCGRYRPKQSVQLRKIAIAYELDNESVLRVFTEFQALGMVSLSGNFTAIVRSPDPKETQEAYEMRAAMEEIAGRTAAVVLKGYTHGLRNELASMRAAVAHGDLDSCAEHDVQFHRAILMASQSDVLLHAWDALAFDLRACPAMELVPKDLHEAVESHQPIVDAIEKGRGREAGLMLRNHVEALLVRLRRAEPRSGFQPSAFENFAPTDGYAGLQSSLRTFRGGLGPARLRRIEELVEAKMEEGLTLHEMAQSVGLSIAHFSQMFHKTTGESPHQFVVRRRVSRAKDMLTAPEARVLDVAVACGFKTQQHFARVFRRICGASPTEYRQEFQGRGEQPEELTNAM